MIYAPAIVSHQVHLKMLSILELIPHHYISDTSYGLEFIPTIFYKRVWH